MTSSGRRERVLHLHHTPHGEAYVDIEAFEGRLWLRIGKQTIVWGKTELFRTTDQFNPQDLALASLPGAGALRVLVDVAGRRCPMSRFARWFVAGARTLAQARRTMAAAPVAEEAV